MNEEEASLLLVFFAKMPVLAKSFSSLKEVDATPISRAYYLPLSFGGDFFS